MRHSSELREVRDGHDSTWVAQIGRLREDVTVTADQLLAVPDGPRTSEALRNNVAVCILYTDASLPGVGCVPLYDLMEDAATAEIPRARHKVTRRCAERRPDDDCPVGWFDKRPIILHKNKGTKKICMIRKNVHKGFHFDSHFIYGISYKVGCCRPCLCVCLRASLRTMTD